MVRYQGLDLDYFVCFCAYLNVLIVRVRKFGG